MKTPLSIGIDLGGTKIIAGVVDGSGCIIEMERRLTPKDGGRETVNQIASLITLLAEKYQIDRAGVAIAGFLSKDRKFIGVNPNIKNLENIDIYDQLVAATGLKIFIENDGNAAAWGEFRFGAGIEANPMAMFTVGTGIGGGLIIDRKLLVGAFGTAGEIGHLPLVDSGELCGCGMRGCLERYASGNALIRSLHRALENKTDEEKGQWADIALEDLSGDQITLAALAGDQYSLAAFAEIGKWLGMAIAGVIALVDPEKIIIGGGVSDAGNILLQPVIESVQLQNRTHSTPEILIGALGNSAGLIGVSDLVRRL